MGKYEYVEEAVARAGVLFVFLVALPVCLPAQRLIDPATARGRELILKIDSLIDSPDSRDELGCNVDSVKPVLNFTFRYQAGYRAEIPVERLEARNGRLTIFLRVRPKNGRPAAYFQSVLRLPPLPEKRRGLKINTSGGFHLGEGEYSVDWIASSTKGLTCSDNFIIKLKLNDLERERMPSPSPGQVTSLRRDRWRGTEEGYRPYRVAILLHASPMYPLGSTLTMFDQSLLVSTLAALLEKTPFRETSIVAFNLQQQKVIFRAQRLRARGFGQLLDAMDELELGSIAVDNLRNPSGASEMLADVVNRIFDHSEMPDAMIFVGPNTVVDAPFRTEWIARSPDKPMPAVYYVHLDFFGRRFPFNDALDRVVKSMDGHTFRIHRASDLAKAVGKIGEELEERRLARETQLRRPETER